MPDLTRLLRLLGRDVHARRETGVISASYRSDRAILPRQDAGGLFSPRQKTKLILGTLATPTLCALLAFESV